MLILPPHPTFASTALALAASTSAPSRQAISSAAAKSCALPAFVTRAPPFFSSVLDLKMIEDSRKESVSSSPETEGGGHLHIQALAAC